MSTAVIFRAVKSGNALHLTAPVAYRRHLETLGDGEEVEIVIRPPAKRSSNQQLRYYRGVVIPDIAAASGITDPEDYEAVHQGLAWKFLRMADHVFGYPQRRSTSKDDMSQAEFSAYLDRVITYAETSIPGCRVRRPDEITDWDHVPDYEWSAA